MKRSIVLLTIASAASSQSIPKQYQFAGFANLSATMARPLEGPILRAIPGKTSEAYLWERGTRVLFRLDHAKGTLTEIVVNPPLNFSANSLAVDVAGNAYLPDSTGRRVVRVSPFGEATTVFRSTSQPHAVALDPAGNLIVAEWEEGLQTIRKLNAQGASRLFFDVRSSAPFIRQMTTDRHGNLYALTSDQRRPILLFNLAGAAVRLDRIDDPVLLSPRVTALPLLRGFGFLTDIAVGRDYSIFLTDFDKHVIWKFATNGYVAIEAGQTIEGTCGPTREPCIKAGYWANGQLDGQERFSSPSSISFDANGRMLIAEAGNGAIRLLTSRQSLITVAGQRLCCRNEEGIPAAQATFGSVRGLTTDNLGNIYAADPLAGRLRKIDPQGMITTILGDGTLTVRHNVPATESGAQPYSVAVDSKGVIYVAEPGLKLIRRVNPNGIVQTLSGSQTGLFPPPEDLVLLPSDAAAVAVGPDDTLYSLGACNVFRWSGDTPQPLLSGSCADRPNGPAASSALDRPTALAVDRNGAIFVATFAHGMRAIRNGRLEAAPDVAPRRGLSRVSQLHAGSDGLLYATSNYPPDPFTGFVPYRVAYAISPQGVQVPISISDFLNSRVISPFRTNELDGITTDVFGRVIVSQRYGTPLLIYPKVSR